MANKEINFVSNGSPLKFFITNVNGKKFNVLIQDKRDYELITFLIGKGILSSTNIPVETIKTKDNILTIIGEPLNEKLSDFLPECEEEYPEEYTEELLSLYKLLSDKDLAVEIVTNLGISAINEKKLNCFPNIEELYSKIHSYEFPYILKTFNGKGGKGTFIVRDTYELNNVLLILEGSNVWKKSEGNYLDKKIIIEKYIENKIDINVNVDFFIEGGKRTFKILGMTQQLSEGTLYRGNTNINNGEFEINTIVEEVSKMLLSKGYQGNIGIDFMIDIDRNIYFNEFNTRFNSSTLFIEYLNETEFKNAEILLFESRNGRIDINELKDFLTSGGIFGNVFPYEVNWDKGTIMFLLKGHSKSKFINKNIQLQSFNNSEEIKKIELIKKIKNYGFFPVRFDLLTGKEKSSQVYYDKVNILESKLPVIVLTGPRGAGKNHFLEIILNMFGNYVNIVPQVSYRPKRIDDNNDYIKIVDIKEFESKKNEMWVYSGKYGILQSDIDQVINNSKIPIIILGWKEILKIKKSSKLKIEVINISFPMSNNGEISENTLDRIYNERLKGRNLSDIEKSFDIEIIKKYMLQFFNHPTFKKLFSYNFNTIDGADKELTDYIRNLINNTLDI